VLQNRGVKQTTTGCRALYGALACAIALSVAPNARAQATPAKPAAPAGAVPDLAAAKRHYAEGEKKFKAGDFAGALPEFQEANEVKETPQAERYMGLCEDSLGHYQAALDWYDKFLAHVPDKLTQQGDELRKRSAEIKAMPGKVHIASNPPGADVTIDDKGQAALAPLDVELPPGTHKIKFSEQGRLPAEKTLEVAFGSSQSINAALEAQPAPPPPPPAPVAAVSPPATPPPPPPPEPRSKVPAFVTGGLAVVAAGVGTVFGVMALNDQSKFNSNPTAQTADDGDTHSLIADMAFGVAITFGVTSVVLFLTKDEPPAATAALSRPASAEAPRAKKRTAMTVVPTPIVGPHSGGAGVAIRF
jgi:hypothetical protein